MLNYLKELLTLSKLFKFKRIFGVFLLVHLLLFNFQWAIRCRISLTACILYHISFPLSRGFSKVFYFFFPNPVAFCDSLSSLVDSSVIISYLSPPCQCLFDRFFHFMYYVHQIQLEDISNVQTAYTITQSHHQQPSPAFTLYFPVHFPRF